MWEATFLGVVVAILVSAAFVGGCFCGSWVQRSIGYIIRTRAEKELLEQAKEREEANYKVRRAVDWEAGRGQAAEDAFEKFSQAPTSNPLGPGLPSPDELDKFLDAAPENFTTNLATERMKRAQSG